MDAKFFDEAKFKMEVRKAWIKTPTNALRNTIAMNENLMGHMQIRNQVIREIIDERSNITDFKVKQYAKDGD